MDETGQASVFIHRREGETAAEVLEPLVAQDPRQLRLGGTRMRDVASIDRALSEHGKAELFTDTYR